MSEQSSDKTEKAEKAEKKSVLRPAQVGATALASLTAAFLASTLGVYGTIAGAGVFSFMLTIGSELYLRSFERTREAARRAKSSALARTAKSGRARDGEPAGAGGATATFSLPSGPTPAEDAPTGERLPPHEATGFVVPLGEQDRGAAGEDERDEAALEGTRRFSLRRVRWPLVIGTSFAVFLLVMLAVTGIERITGHAISGQGGSTIGTVVGGDSDEQPAPSPRDEDPDEPDGPAEPDEQVPEPTSPEEGTGTPEPTEQQDSPPAEEQDEEPEQSDSEPVDEPEDDDTELPDDQGAAEPDEPAGG